MPAILNQIERFSVCFDYIRMFAVDVVDAKSSQSEYIFYIPADRIEHASQPP